ncbi:MAG: hypothetical protein Q8K19_19665 [Methylicorpusculum sp.]|uniref:P-loop ATPase, Sll1717 family n=1 Tax=Methylicorpusculum sp. TaxID=2713644 RepID=UPI00272F5AEB|nr:hypothetical protein [Methylicorpusculum sp.]MDP2180725.1 hypothetical protein [Methylicorpusculum sp.]
MAISLVYEKLLIIDRTSRSIETQLLAAKKTKIPFLIKHFLRSLILNKSNNPIIIKRGLRLGDLEAETDRKLLADCFIDNGDIGLLEDVDKPESIVVGRTGSGKSALLIQIQNTVEKSKFLDPNDISIRFLEHSDIIQFFEALGINIDLFYRMLWRHILTIELLKLRYDLKSKQDSQNILSKLTCLVIRDPVKEEALSYFKEWGEKFWLDTDQQLKEVTEKLSRDLKAGFGSSIEGIDISLEGAKNISTEKKTEILHKANKVVSQLQIKKLADILDLLEEKVFTDDQKRFYLLIDKLDEDWANTDTRYRFIRALIEEVKTFRKLRNVKIIISLRRDLLEIVFNKTRDAGFQEEKYESYFLHLKWNKIALASLIEKRISEVFKRQYTRDNVTFNDIFPSPKKGGGQTAIDYVLERSLLRPRDVLQFINECFLSALDSQRVSWRAIIAAEATYSEKRLKSLFEEWSEIFPGLIETIEILRNMPDSFKRSMIIEKIDPVSEKLVDYPNDPCGKALIEYCKSTNKQFSDSDLITEILNCFYRVGAVGVKCSTTEPFMWSDYDHAILSKSEIKRVNQIKIHRMLWRALGIKNTKTNDVEMLAVDSD